MRLLLVYIAFLNLLDATLTTYGLHFNYITEGNSLMNYLYLNRPWLFLYLKLRLSVLLLIILYYVSKKKKASKILLSIAIVDATSYTITCFLHGYWIVDLMVS